MEQEGDYVWLWGNILVIYVSMTKRNASQKANRRWEKNAAQLLNISVLMT